MNITNYPKIGIHPIIDGRKKGIREPLEETTMNIARNIARLYSQTLHYLDGSPIECVIADTCIGGVKEAANCAKKFERKNIGLSLPVTPCWCYGSETIDMNPSIPKAIWGSTAQSVPERCTWQRLWLRTTRKDYRHSVSMVATFRTSAILFLLTMYRKSCCVLYAERYQGSIRFRYRKRLPERHVDAVWTADDQHPYCRHCRRYADILERCGD